MGKYDELAKVIIENVGGKSNVVGLKHCITRLRFTLKDETKTNTEVLKNTEGIVTVVQSAGLYQVVIGQHVDSVYDAIMKVGEFENNLNSTQESEEKSKGIISAFISTVTSVFTPILGMLCAAGMLKGFSAAAMQFGLLTKDSGAYMFWYYAGDALFYFLPVLIAYTSSKKFKLNEITGLMIGLTLCVPSLVEIGSKEAIGTIFGTAYQTSFFGIPIILPKSGSYVQTVIPIIVAIWVASKLEKKLKKVLPQVIKSFMIPFLVLVIIIPLVFIIIGPITNWLAEGLGLITSSIYGIAPWLEGMILGAAWQVMVLFGLHWGVSPIRYNNFAVLGYDTVVTPFFTSSFAQTATVIAIAIKTKDKKLKGLCSSAAISGIFGVTEPAIYGITLPRKKPFVISCIGSGIGGAILGMLKVRGYSGGVGIFALSTFIDPQTGDMTGVIYTIIAILIASAVSFVLTLMFYKETGEITPKGINAEEAHNQTTKVIDNLDITMEVNTDMEVEMQAPISGKVIELSEIEDPVFSQGLLGKGCAIIPNNGEVVAPFDGEIMSNDNMKHAVALVADNGAEVLIHVGMDTVQLEGKYYKSFVKCNDKVKRGQKLLAFDMEGIKKSGYSLVTPIIITNSETYENITTLKTSGTIVNTGEGLLKIDCKQKI